MTKPIVRKQRCAIYTRKSSEDPDPRFKVGSGGAGKG